MGLAERLKSRTTSKTAVASSQAVLWAVDIPSATVFFKMKRLRSPMQLAAIYAKLFGSIIPHIH
jgi:hypothetical protein